MLATLSRVMRVSWALKYVRAWLWPSVVHSTGVPMVGERVGVNVGPPGVTVGEDGVCVALAVNTDVPDDAVAVGVGVGAPGVQTDCAGGSKTAVVTRSRSVAEMSPSQLVSARLQVVAGVTPPSSATAVRSAADRTPSQLASPAMLVPVTVTTNCAVCEASPSRVPL